MTEARNDSLIAYALTRDTFTTGCPEIARTVRDRYGADARVVVNPSDEDGPGGILSVDGIGISVMSVPYPIPAGDELRGLARSSRDPEGDLARHAEHVVIGALEKHVGHEATLRALAVLKVCYALCEVQRASAVLFECQV